MTVSEFEEFVNFKRFSHYSSYLPLIIYLPFGFLLGIIRLFIFLHALILNLVLPEKFPLKRVKTIPETTGFCLDAAIAFFRGIIYLESIYNSSQLNGVCSVLLPVNRFFLKVMFFVTGIPISVHGSPKITGKKILVGNSVTNLDPFILSFLWPNTLVVEDASMSMKTVLPQHINVPGEENHDQIVIKMKESVKDSNLPLLFFPERMKTNGKKSLLQFHNLAFEMDSPIQPITIQTTRFLFDVSVSTLSSSLVEDLFWCLVLPMTLFTVKYLPLTERKRDENISQFAVRVHSNMAKSMGIGTSTLNNHDVIEYVKRKVSEPSTPQSQRSISHSDAAAEGHNTGLIKTGPKSNDHELDLMLTRVQDVFPDIPPRCLLTDLKTTRDVDATITNVIEGRVDTTAPSEPPTIQTTSQAEFSFKAKLFEKRAADRQLSFAERKLAMLEAARLKYKQKHGLL